MNRLCFLTPLIAWLLVPWAQSAEPSPAFIITPVQGRAFVLTEKGFLNRTAFKWAGAFSCDLAAVLDRESELCGFLDRSGRMVLPFQWKSVTGFDPDSRLSAAQDKDSGLWGYIGTAGHWVIPPSWDAAGAMTKAGAAVVIRGRKWGMIKTSGQIVVEPQWDEVGGFNPGPAHGITPFRVGPKWGYATADGRVLIEPRFTGARSHTKCGLARVQSEGLWGFVDAQGSIAIAPRWPEARAFYGPAGSARAAVKDGKSKWGFIDESGTLVVPHRYDDIQPQTAEDGPFERGRALVQRDRLWGVINANGEELLPCTWDGAWLGGPGSIAVGRKTANGWRLGLVDEAGRTIEPVEMENIIVDDRSGWWATSRETTDGREYRLHRPDGQVFGPFPLSLDFPPPSTPFLRIEAGMQTAAITRIGADAAGRVALTCSNDKTARLWALPEPNAATEGEVKAELLRTFRIPVGNGDEGKICACALSPDGSTAALGGSTGSEWDGTQCIYLFDTATGRLRKRITGLPSSVFDLAFSPSGLSLAAGLGTGNGIRVWSMATAQEIARDTDYGDGCYGLDWRGEDRLVTTSDDGYVRLYAVAQTSSPASAAVKQNGSSTPLKKSKFPLGKQPFAIRFSPSGLELAVGFKDKPAVAILSATDLSLIHQPSAKGINNGSLSSVAWSADGRSLAAGGRWKDDKGAIPTRIWPQAGRGQPQDVPVAQSTLLNLRPLPGGGFLFSAGDPAFGIVHPVGAKASAQPLLLGSPPTADYRGAGSAFRLAADATEVAFGYEQGGKSPGRFDLRQRQLRLGRSEDSRLHSPLQERTGIELTSWRDSTDPKLNGQPLAFPLDETSRCYAIGQPGSGFVLGADWTLRTYDPLGLQRWQQPVPSVVWAVNLSEMGKLVVAAYGDGTIRWHRNDQGGKEVLAFFPHADRKRWVLWTPEGYYDCSPGAEELIGWHVNRAKTEAADFHPASKFREQFYRPDVIDQLLSTWDVNEAVTLADEKSGRKPNATSSSPIEEIITKMQPPVVTLLSGGVAGALELAQGVTTVSLRYRVRRGTGAEVRRVRLLMDGRPMDAELPIPSNDEQEMTAQATIPPDRGCVLSLLAENQHAVSVPVTISVKRAAAPISIPPQSTVLKPKLYILCVGVSDYSDISGLRDLGLAAKDARDLSAVFKGQEGLLYQKVETRTLTDKDAIATNIKDGLDWVRQQTTAKDVCVILLAGHGDNDNQGRYFFCPHDYDASRKLSTTVGFKAIRETVSTLPGKVLFFIDTCHAGNALGKMVATRDGSSGPDINRIANELSSADNGAVVFSSSTGRQLSQEKAEWGNGAFTKAVVEGLKGEADLLKNGKITVAGLEYYVAERVKALTGGEQTPTVTKPQSVSDFTIAVKP